jgi:tRNA pseudouridine13 synthase
MCSAISNRPTASVAIRPTDFALAGFHGLPHPWGRPSVTGRIRSSPEDFRVSEDLAFSLTGAGEHLYLRVRKSGQNTRWVAKQIARALDLPFRSVGYAGLKDRHAETEQWFSLHLPGRPDPDLDTLGVEGLQILEIRRHVAKLRIGALTGNRFRIVVRQLQGDRSECAARLERLRDHPVPNYFGPQRFGRGGQNLELLRGEGAARTLNREARSFGLSALRSALFNVWLAERIEDESWCTPLDGEIVYSEALVGYRHIERVTEADRPVQPTGLLWGVGENQATAAALVREHAFFDRYADDTGLLSEHAVRMMRRPLGMGLRDLRWDFRADRLELEFRLGRGQYATSALREIIDLGEQG